MAPNGIDYLQAQHERITQLIGMTQNGSVEERQGIFNQLRELLAVHETAEELVLRPVTRKEVPGGEEIAGARIGEENMSKDALADLEKLDVRGEEFATMFASFAADVAKHAYNEETYEFPLVREHQDHDALAAMGEALEKAESSAPTHPHPSARSTGANAALGPVAAVVDKVRDALSND